MIIDIVKDIEKLEAPCKNATKNDLYIVKDLLDTVFYHKDKCLGLAANQIGYNSKIIAVRTGEDKFMVMINPLIVKKSTQQFVSVESCLSLEGERMALRHRNITVMYQDKNFKIRKMNCSGLLSIIVQHEIDHCNGKII